MVGNRYNMSEWRDRAWEISMVFNLSWCLGCSSSLRPRNNLFKQRFHTCCTHLQPTKTLRDRENTRKTLHSPEISQNTSTATVTVSVYQYLDVYQQGNIRKANKRLFYLEKIRQVLRAYLGQRFHRFHACLHFGTLLWTMFVLNTRNDLLLLFISKLVEM